MNVFTARELSIISDALLHLIQTNTEVSKYIADQGVRDKLSDISSEYNKLNQKVCDLMDSDDCKNPTVIDAKDFLRTCNSNDLLNIKSSAEELFGSISVWGDDGIILDESRLFGDMVSIPYKDITRITNADGSVLWTCED